MQGFFDCASADTCNTQECFDGCVASNPMAGQAYLKLDACRNKSCVTGCVCAPSDADAANPCLACVKSKCCTDFGALINSSDYAVFDACLNGCGDGDTACLDACFTASPMAGAAYDTLNSSCLSDTCSTECAP